MGSSPGIHPASARFGPPPPGTRAFTLIELLVVIGIIGILASLVVAFVIPKSQQAALHQATAEMRLIEAAIDSYHADFGTYPPDNPRSNLNLLRTFKTWNLVQHDYLQPLYYELSGAAANPPPAGQPVASFGAGQTYVAAADYSAFFGLGGPQNSSPPSLKSYLKDLKPTQYKAFPGTQVFVLTCSIGTPASPADLNLNPWSYNSSSPTNNPAGYDLFNTNILVGNKYYTIGNWNR
jgi:prepilin-type N-terminal cleavage/methylation domain-containing protein